jgi:hypothetical protein
LRFIYGRFQVVASLIIKGRIYIKSKSINHKDRKGFCKVDKEKIKMPENMKRKYQL